MNQEFADRLIALRKQNGYSQEELAAKLGVSRQAVSNWERAETSPDTDKMIALAKLYGCTIDTLVNPPASADAELPEGSFYHQEREDKAKDDARETPKPRFRKDFPYGALVTVIYLVLGFCFHLWHPGWIIFLTVPLFYLPDSERGYLQLLGNPVMVTIIYLLLGFCCNLWHPGWLIFLAVPLLNELEKPKKKEQEKA